MFSTPVWIRLIPNVKYLTIWDIADMHKHRKHSRVGFFFVKTEAGKILNFFLLANLIILKI